MGKEERTELGSVAVYVVSPTRTVLVFEETHPKPCWKLPGGVIERFDRDIISAAIREVAQETHIFLLRKEIILLTEHYHENGTYYPFFCLARVTDAKLNTYEKIGYETGGEIRAAKFQRRKVPNKVVFLDRHRGFVRRIESAAA